MKHNPDVVKLDSQGRCKDEINNYKEAEIVLPYIYEKLKDEFPDDLEDFIKKNDDLEEDI
jgi:hypothetical protein